MFLVIFFQLFFVSCRRTNDLSIMTRTRPATDLIRTGIVCRGPCTYRRNASGTLTFESAAFDGGRLTEAGPRYFVTDHLGSVRAVIDGNAAQQLPIRRRGSTRSTTTLRTGPSQHPAHHPTSALRLQARQSHSVTPSPVRKTRARTSGCRTSTTAQGSTARASPAGSSPTRWERSTMTSVRMCTAPGIR